MNRVRLGKSLKYQGDQKSDRTFGSDTRSFHLIACCKGLFGRIEHPGGWAAGHLRSIANCVETELGPIPETRLGWKSKVKEQRPV